MKMIINSSENNSSKKIKLNRVMCFGTFDLLHPGHLNYLEQAKKQGDYLIVVIARDETKIKQNKKTLFSENNRLIIIKSLKVVDEAVLGNVDDHFKVILEKKPQVICLGYDHQISEKELEKKLEERGLIVKVKRM
ncbi:FAD synthase, partial [Candidatus Woesearchaeota archaeon]|nr:FAD synthase [Candidatus Woesearchaeota archaeon]